MREAIRGHQRQSEAITRGLELLELLMREAIRCHQRQSEAITRGLELLELLMREAIRGHQRQSEAITRGLELLQPLLQLLKLAHDDAVPLAAAAATAAAAAAGLLVLSRPRQELDGGLQLALEISVRLLRPGRRVQRLGALPRRRRLVVTVAVPVGRRVRERGGAVMSNFACSAPVAERVRRRGGRAVVVAPWWSRRGGRAHVAIEHALAAMHVPDTQI